MKNLKQLKKKIQSAMPEIMECGIKRDITLEDVLIVLDKKRYLMAVNNNGEFIDIKNGGKWHYPPEYENLGEFPVWQLNKPLQDQKEEIINFLDDIL